MISSFENDKSKIKWRNEIKFQSKLKLRNYQNKYFVFILFNLKNIGV